MCLKCYIGLFDVYYVSPSLKSIAWLKEIYTAFKTILFNVIGQIHS